ncbi:hypothetical protein ZTR_07906 [Talaromyces verruculosus]|nr:hypothetical protein ZTR_07906 [Talaromyces verruculosus]
MSKFKVIIVGGGLAGPLLASGLLQKGIEVELYEKLEENSKRDGFTIRVAQPCLQAFQECLSAEQFKKIKKRMGRFEDNEETTPIWYDYKMNPLLNMSRFSTSYHGSSPMDRVVLRDTIMEAPLREGIVYHGKSLHRYDSIKTDNGDEKVRVWFEDGTSADGDILIAADGSHSRINKQVGLNHIQQLDAISFVTKVRLSKDMLARLPAPCLVAPVIAFSHRKTYFAVGKKRQEGIDDIDEDDLDFDNQTASFTFTMILPTADCPSDILEWDKAKQWQFLSEAINNWHENYRQIIEVVRGQDIYTFRPRAAVRPSLNWRSRVRSPQKPLQGHPRVWFMGDAMHAMMPNRGMGGNQAMLDAKVILPFMERLNNLAKASGSVSEDAIATACTEYEEEMIPGAFEWVEASGGTNPVPFDTNLYVWLDSPSFGYVRLLTGTACLLDAGMVKDSDRQRCAKACGNCKRRKERCDRSRPCRRCVSRRVETQCRSSSSPTSSTVRPEQVSYVVSQPQPSYLCSPSPTSQDAHQHDRAPPRNRSDCRDKPDEPAQVVSSSDIAAACSYSYHLSETVCNGCNDIPFVGNTASLSLLQQVHQLVEKSLGPSSIPQKNLQHHLVEPCGRRASFKLTGTSCPPNKPTLVDSIHLAKWCLRATNSVLGVVNEEDLLHDMFQWVRTTSNTASISDPVYYLVLAIGAQTCPEDRDELAETYFEYGQHLTTNFFMDDPRTIAVQCHILATLYLLGASRRNAAFMVFGNALDVFTSVPLGRPLATRECRDTTADEDYSPSNDLCSIFEMILVEVYTKHQVAVDSLQRVTERHRQWAGRLNFQFPEGFDTYSTWEPNITLLNLKESYYWTIMLLARPFLLQTVFSHVAQSRLSEMRDAINTSVTILSTSPECILAHACVDSAVRNLDMLEGLLSTPYLPKRLPFTINSVFSSVMTLSIAQFADFDLVFPLGKSLDFAQRLLGKFRVHDAVADHYFSITEYLRGICDEYLERRLRREMERQNLPIRSMIGSIHEPSDVWKEKNTESVEDSMAPCDPIGPASMMHGSIPFDMQWLSGTQTSMANTLDRFDEFMLPDLLSPTTWLQ